MSLKQTKLLDYYNTRKISSTNKIMHQQEKKTKPKKKLLNNNNNTLTQILCEKFRFIYIFT